MKSTQRLGLSLLALWLFVPAAAIAQDGVAPTATGETGLFTLFTADTVPQGDWSFGLYYNNWDRVFEFNDDFDLDYHQLSASVGWGITENFELYASVPYLNLDPDFGNDDTLFGGDNDDQSGLGNARVGGSGASPVTPGRRLGDELLRRCPDGRRGRAGR